MKILIPFYLLLMATVSLSCHENSDENVWSGTWQLITLQNPTEDSILNAELANYSSKVDTMTVIPKNLTGKFQSENLDSFKYLLKKELTQRYNNLASNNSKPFDKVIINKSEAEFHNESQIWKTDFYTTKFQDNTLLFFDQLFISQNGDFKCFIVLKNSVDTLIIKSHSNAHFSQIFTLIKNK